MQAFSERLRQRSRGQLQAALDRFDLGKLLGARPATGGLFGQNVFLTSDSGEWVLRGAPHWPWQFAKERFFAEQLHRETMAPVPWPYLLEESEDLFGWNYALMPRLPGTSPAELRGRVGPVDLCAIARVMGGGLAELHRLAAVDPGEYDPNLKSARREASFSDWVMRSLQEWQKKILRIPRALDDADLTFIAEVIEMTRRALEEPFQPCFVHYDYTEGNVLVERAESGWRLNGIFDLMTCAFGDGEQDLPRFTASLAFPDLEAARSFIAAYRDRRPFRPGFAERFRLYMLMDRMILWEYGRRNRLWFPDETRFRDFARGFLSLDSILNGDGAW